MDKNKIQKDIFFIRQSMLLLFVILLLSFEAFSQFKITKFEPDPFFQAERNKFNALPLLRYNRVAGPVIGMDYSFVAKKMRNIELSGQACFGLQDKFRYRAGIQKAFFVFNPLTVGAAYFDQISTQDDWIISYNENSAAAFFIKEDFMDYYSQQGFIAFVDHKFAEVHTIRLEVDQRHFKSLAKHTNWALLGKKKNFRDNPAVFEEKAVGIRLLWALDWRNNPLLPNKGWYVEGKLEQTLGKLTDTRGLFLTVKRYQPAFSIHSLQMKLLIGTRSGADLGNQYLMDLGGLGSLVAYKDKEFTNGNRLLLATARYLFNGDVLSRLPLHFLPFYDQLSLGMFVESGWLFLAGEEKNVLSGFSSLTAKQLKTDFGISLYITEGVVRIDFAKRTDRSENAWRFTLRLMEQF